MGVEDAAGVDCRSRRRGWGVGAGGGGEEAAAVRVEALFLYLLVRWKQVECFLSYASYAQFRPNAIAICNVAKTVTGTVAASTSAAAASTSCFCMCCQPIPQTALPNWPLTDERAALTDWVPVLFQPLLLAGLAATSNALVNAAWPTVARLMSNSLCCCTGCAKWQINLSLLQQREQISIKVRAP